MKNIVGKFAALTALSFLVFAAAGSAQMMGEKTTPQSQQSQAQSQQQGQQTQQQGQQTQTPPGQSGQQGQQGAQGAAAAPTAPAAPPVDPKEEAAYKQFQSMPLTADPKTVASVGESFVKTYPSSRYNGVVYSRLTTVYLQLNDDPKMFDAGNKALAIVPDNVDVLPVLAMAYSRRIDAGALDADQKMKMVETYANSGILLLNQLQKPANVTDNSWDNARNTKLAMCHSGLGLVDFYRAKYTEAVQQFTEATKLEGDPDPVDQYLLGKSFEGEKDFPNAITTLDTCAKQAGSPQLQNMCKTALDEVKKKAAGKQ
jgi:tetratricopeptide (TPR) repeat protein